MFDPFFTTKGVGKGTGLGLSLVHGIVADLGGAIDVATQAGAGTPFTVWLPLAGETVRPAAAAAAEPPHGAGETVMVGDDERSLGPLAEPKPALLGHDPAGLTSTFPRLPACPA